MSLKFFAPPPKPRRLLVILVRINKLHQNISGAVYKKRSTWAQKTKGCTVVCIFLVVQSQCDLGHIKQRKDVKKKAMWNVQCIEVWRATFMTSPPVSPVRWLENKRKKKCYWVFILGFVPQMKVCGILLSFDGNGFFS